MPPSETSTCQAWKYERNFIFRWVLSHNLAISLLRESWLLVCVEKTWKPRSRLHSYPLDHSKSEYNGRTMARLREGLWGRRRPFRSSLHIDEDCDIKWKVIAKAAHESRQERSEDLGQGAVIILECWMLDDGSQPPPARYHASYIFCMLIPISSGGALEILNQSFQNIYATPEYFNTLLATRACVYWVG